MKITQAMKQLATLLEDEGNLEIEFAVSKIGNPEVTGKVKSFHVETNKGWENVIVMYGE